MKKTEYPNGVEEIFQEVKDHPDVIIQFDGGVRPKNPGRFCCFGYLVFNQKNELLAKGFRWLEIDRATNNYSEYSGVVFGLKLLLGQQWQGNSVTIQGDSQLICYQLNKSWRIKDQRLGLLAQEIWTDLDKLGLVQHNEENSNQLLPKTWDTRWVRRNKNASADQLTHLAWEHCTRKIATKEQS